MSGITGLLMTAAELPEPDTSSVKPWALDMLCQVEPELEAIAAKAVGHNRRRCQARLDAYTKAKHEALKLVGWYARDPRLRSTGAWDCFFRYILNELRI